MFSVGPLNFFLEPCNDSDAHRRAYRKRNLNELGCEILLGGFYGLGNIHLVAKKKETETFISSLVFPQG